MNKMLLIVDPQIDFINGTMPVPGAESAMDSLAGYLRDCDGMYSHKIVTADRHPFDHCSFEMSGGEWPRHCIHDTVGAALWPNLLDPLYLTAGEVVFLYKGESRDSEEYSILSNIRGRDFIEKTVETGDIGQIDICGLSGDICVLNTVRDAMMLIGTDRINVLTAFSPSLDGGIALMDLITKQKLPCDRS